MEAGQGVPPHVDGAARVCHHATIPMDHGIKPSFGGMTAWLAVGITAAVVVACAGSAYLYSEHHMKSLLDTARTTALAEGDLIRVALEHQMIENDRTLIAKMIESFRKQARVERLVLLDRTGAERYPAPGSRVPDPDLQIASPTCQACHRYPPSERGTSRVIDTRGGSVLRTVIPIRNREECYGCHDPSHKINGILILDYNAEELRAETTRDMRWLVTGTALVTLLLVGAIGAVIRVAVLRRLQRFETAARKIAGGDLGQRVPAKGTDTLSWLAASSIPWPIRSLGWSERCATSASGWRRSSTVSTTASWCWMPTATSSPPTTRFCCGRNTPARRCWAVAAANWTPAAAMSKTARRSPACGRARARSASASAAQRKARRPGRRCTPRRFSMPPANCCRWWRSGATFPSGARRRRTWPSRTGWLRWEPWRRASRTN